MDFHDLIKMIKMMTFADGKNTGSFYLIKEAISGNSTILCKRDLFLFFKQKKGDFDQHRQRVSLSMAVVV